MADARYLVLARKWRPQFFEDVVGQEHITRTLKNAIGSGRIHHAFLFVGSRGIGKTTTARILAKALNCLSSESPTTTPCGTCENCTSIGRGTNIDVIEIDGASNNGVDDVREIRDNVRMVPSHGRYKVYIIDEVHQLSSGAFNALLKTLEEPPAHALFVLATTEAHKIPATIISRCQRYDFRRVGSACLVELLRKITQAEGIQANDDALYAIARAAEGGVRDAESILDELITYCQGEIRFQDVFDALGLVDWRALHDLCDAVLRQDVVRLLTLVDEVVSAGKDLSQFVQEILRYFRDLLVCKTADAAELLHLPEDELREVRQQAAGFTLTNLIRLVEQFAELTKGFDSQLAQRIALESMLIRISKATAEVSLDTVLEKLLLLGAGGVALPAGTTEIVAPPAAPGSAPPNPPEAGPGEWAPPAPAPAIKRLTLNPAHVANGWRAVIESAREISLNLGVWMAQGIPVALEDGIIVVSFPSDCQPAQAYVQRPENVDIINEILAGRFDNVTGYRTRLEAPAPTPVEERSLPDSEPASGSAAYAAVDPEKAHQALEDPVIAKVVEVFKGRIAEIRPLRPTEQ